MDASPIAGCSDELTRDVVADGRSGLAGPPQSLEDVVGHVHLWHFVLQVLGVAHVAEGHDAEQQRHLRGRIDGVEQALERLQVVGRRSHQEVRAVGQLAPGAFDLVREVVGRRVHPRPDHKPGRPTHGYAVVVAAFVQSV